MQFLEMRQHNSQHVSTDVTHTVTREAVKCKKFGWLGTSIIYMCILHYQIKLVKWLAIRKIQTPVPTSYKLYLATKNTAKLFTLLNTQYLGKKQKKATLLSPFDR